MYAREGDDLLKMSEPECQTVRELDDLRPQNDNTAIANVGLCESDLSAHMAKRRVCEAAMSRIDVVVFSACPRDVGGVGLDRGCMLGAREICEDPIAQGKIWSDGSSVEYRGRKARRTSHQCKSLGRSARAQPLVHPRLRVQLSAMSMQRIVGPL